ncbi:Card1-like endonuclease domain-containing protein [Clostridium chauvoei]|uniref:Card1-like endonuclease domain-containing protein n=1 Tax=Clostridium chauvoei TaxID=46867 RepID=UPI001FAB25C7|nr:DUF1887 family CARF protein [Clostridium chauvoei]
MGKLIKIYLLKEGTVMEVDTLINQLDEHNEGNILATKKFKCKEVIFIRSAKEESSMKAIKEYYNTYMPQVVLKECIIEEGENDKLRGLIDNNKNKNILINLTGGRRINSLILLMLCSESNIKSVYVDIKKKVLYIIDDGVKIKSEEFGDLEVDDIIKASGGDVLQDSTALCDKEDLVYLTKEIYRNLSLWHKYKQKLYDSNIFIHDYQDSKRVLIKTKLLDKSEKDLLNKILNKLKEMNGIRYTNINDDELEVYFLNEYLKGFIFKSGTWLEMATNMMIQDIKDIDQVKRGVIFLWNNDVKVVRNEVDVVAVKDSVPICISCKDSDKYNEMALNELNVYSEKIGGEKAYKILVATKEPIKASVRERAKEMGIHLVIFDGDENKFRKSIQSIVKNNN